MDDSKVYFKCNLHFIIFLIYIYYIFKNDYNTMNKDNNSQSTFTLILKPSIGSSQFANLQLKLNLEKSVFNSYQINIII